MPEPMDPSRADKRLVKRYITKKLLDEKTFEKHLKNLPDLAEKVGRVETVVETDDDQAGE